ncbi:outer membrane beta-barrel protein [Niabella ginsenosidivorans]|uniref:outer membrane beta-barrel protein n=1 Tax=Niabella ginsenosidivorans TaxID=1176587 RepID=UPI0014714BC3|nr:outer membrane beta-barrel protein [Niabella ginsenosidivorans]
MIKGQIADSLQQPVAWATITLAKGDSVIFTTPTNEHGAFSFAIKRGMGGSLTITSAAYLPFTTPIHWGQVVSGKLDLGRLTLQQSGKNLQNVTVTAARPLIKKETDKLVYNTEADPESKFRSVLDIMKKVPYLSVDGQENLTLKGNSSYRILINGKPSGAVDNDPKNFLKTLPASTIQSIEVYTIPPAKYDAEGLGGVINIITTKRVGEGYKGSTNISEGFPSGGPSGGFSFTATHKKLGVELYGGGSFSSNPRVANTTNRTTSGDEPTHLNVSGNHKSRNNGRYIGTQFSYDLDSLQLFTVQLNLNEFNSKDNRNRSSVLQQEATTLQQFTMAGKTIAGNNGFDGGLNYQLGFRNDKSRLLTVSYRYMQYKTSSTDYNDFLKAINYPVTDFNQYNNTSTMEHTGQVDYIQNIKKVKMEAGIKTIFRDNKSQFNTMEYDSATDRFLDDPAQQDAFTNHQAILSAYNTYSFSLKSWGFKAGARLEETINDIDFASTQTTVNNNYFSLVPSVVINKSYTNGTYISLGYNQRLKRPGINRLNPFVNLSDPNFITYGNPDLKPSLIHNFDLGYGSNKKQSINIGLSYAFSNNLDLKTSRYDTASKVTFTTYDNSGKIAALMLNYNLNLAITKALRTVINGNIANFWIQSAVDLRIVKTQQLLYTATISNKYTFTKGWIVNASVYLYGKNLAPAQIQGTVSGYAATGFSVSKNLIENKLSLSAYINNPFTKFRNSRTEITSYDFAETTLNQEYFRKAGFSINYRFGKLKRDIKKNKRGISNNDVSN